MKRPEDTRVLIGCEMYGEMRKAFEALGFDAWSCDLLPDVERSNRHMQCDIREVLHDGWDFLAVMHPPCFEAGTLVLTDRGFMPIERVLVGDMVLTHCKRWRRVTEVMSKPAHRLVSLKSQNGLPITTTPEHPFYAVHREPYSNSARTLDERDSDPQWVEAGQLGKRDFLLNTLPPEKHCHDYSSRELWLMGRYVADGHMRKSRWTDGKFEEMRLSIGEKKVDEFESMVTDPKYTESNGAVRKAVFYGHEKIVRYVQFGTLAHEKRLPGWVLSLPKEQATSFLSGYVSGDGYVKGNGIACTTVSRELALGIAILIQRVHGVVPTISTPKLRQRSVIEGREVQCRQQYVVSANCVSTNRQKIIRNGYGHGNIKEFENRDLTTLIPVYNLSVEEDESYTANGVIVHNCTRLCNSGVRWLSKPPNGKTLDQMWQELDEGAALFSDCWNAPIPHVACENPVMHKHAKERIRNFQPAAQTVQPWWFGEPAFKATGLYLRGLPKLVPTDKLTPPKPGTDEHKAWSAIHRAPPGPDRWKFRSKTFPGIARAAAEQWGAVLTQEAAA